MLPLKLNPRFCSRFEEMTRVRLNPRRHTAANAAEHALAVADMAVRLGRANGHDAETLLMLENLGLAHDIGKVTGTARPERSVQVLTECRITDSEFLALVKWHDVSLPWWRSARRGETPRDRAWSRLEREVRIPLLCLFMVADRVDAPPGWRGNPPTMWFLEQARQRSLAGDLVLDLPNQPSLVSVAGVITRRRARGEETLLVGTDSSGYRLPEAQLMWDELPAAAAERACREAIGCAAGDNLAAADYLGAVDEEVNDGDRRYVKRSLLFRVYANDVSALESKMNPSVVWRTIAEGALKVGDGTVGAQSGTPGAFESHPRLA